MDELEADRSYHLDSLTEKDRQLLTYCAEMSTELSRMMRRRGFLMIAYLLAMAAMEAKNYGKG